MATLNCLFIVQGEGRGHMTQALALKRVLEEAGHSVVSVIVGKSDRREVPRFFLEKVDAPLTFIESPNFVADGAARAVRMVPTVWYGLRQLRHIGDSLQRIHAQMERHRPDVVVNFFEPMAGAYYMRYRPRIPMVAVAHQYMFHHPAYQFPSGRRMQRIGAKIFADITAYGATRRLALSLYPGQPLPRKNTIVMPPLLRPELFQQPLGRTQPFFLVYLLNNGYAEEVVRWHEAHPDVELHCFWDRPDADDVEAYDDTLTFHRIDDEKFLSMMARCQGLICTAGFESIGEAMYLGKPVQVVPVEGHFEQWCNAFDTVRAGAGIRSETFDISRLRQYTGTHAHHTGQFRQWLVAARAQFLHEVEAAAGVETTQVSAPRFTALEPAA